MKVPKNIQTREASLSFDELEKLAEEIRMIITKGRPYTIREYISIVQSINIKDFGYRKARALLFEPKLESYFPDKVYKELHKKGLEARRHVFNEEDDRFIRTNIYKGLNWLSDRFYTDRGKIYDRVVELDLVTELMEEDLEFVKNGIVESEKV